MFRVEIIRPDSSEASNISRWTEQAPCTYIPISKSLFYFIIYEIKILSVLFV